MVRNERISIEGKPAHRTDGWKTSAGIRLLLFVLLGLLFYMAVANRLIPQTYDIEIGSVSEKTIYATKQIENAIETQKAKEEAARRVQPVYSILPMKNETLVEAIFEKLRQINADDQLSTTDKVNVFRNVFPTMYNDHAEMLYASIKVGEPGNEGLLNEVKTALRDQQYRIPEEVYFKFPRLTKEDLDAMEPVARDVVVRLMNDQLTNAQTARTRVAELVNTSPLTKNTSREMVQEIARFVITPNKFSNQKATEEERAEARENTKPVYINKGDVLVHKGERVTEETYGRLKDMDLLKEKVNYWPQLGLAMMSALFVLALYMYVRQSEQPIRHNNVQLLMLVLIYVLNVTGMKIVALGQNLEYANIGYLAPVAMGAMLIAILIGMPIAFISSILFALLSSVIYNVKGEELFDFRYGLVALVVCITSVFAIQRANQRASILKAGVMVSLFGAVTIVSLIFLDNVYTRNEIMLSFGFAVASGLLTAVLVIGLMPFFEVSFGILSPLKLVELSNPNHPLLRKLLTETPGTYHHSVMVGNLSEAAAESVGANGLLCRVGSFYHDIGKTKRPSYFIENQTNIENPHDHIEPSLSKSIIIAHARDGSEMLKEYNMPKPIRDIAEQHHGTTLLKYFYFKAKKQQEEGAEPIPEEEYRYPGPKAQSKEAAIVGIADCVEAAVRSLRNPSIEQIDTMVRKIIKDRLDDGQFNECDLTLKELDTIAKTLNETLLGIFHSRIEYPADAPAKTESKEVKQA
ncbi:HD family phosphohydrolase [Paenibacillus flagellatus]|uniref:Metal-dependent phosphohydrolase n=1 Tax=Paenibacillus flagellatus TaxID=2211139 RepID=A0A2V5KLR0_9BACL|nr:HDIG domain-containing metalloprotein [Paenibacillus flagellatus]PYI51757.1 metal-dependent phosphohydrolase [Paenibacillus flagellatus]